MAVNETDLRSADCGIRCSGLGQGQVAGSFECCNELLCSIKCGGGGISSPAGNQSAAQQGLCSMKLVKMVSCLNSLLFFTEVAPVQRSRYSDSLRRGRSGDRITVGGEIFRTCTDRPWGPPSLLVQLVQSLSRG